MRLNFEMLRGELQHYLTWTQEQVLPFWARSVFDPAGGFYEQLHLDGSPDRTAPRRVRVQARLVYAFAHAAHLGWGTGLDTLVRHGAEYLGTHCRMLDAAGSFAGYAFQLDEKGTVSDPRSDTYTLAFILLSQLWRYKALGEEKALAEMDESLAYLEETLASAHGGWEEAAPARLPRRQNPHMHLLEVMLVGYETTGRKRFLDHADHICTLFETVFLNRKTLILREFFTNDWQIDPEQRDSFEPGHMMEWCWLLDWYAKVAGKDYAPLIRKLYVTAACLGRNQKTGFLVNRVSQSGDHVDPNSRLWPQIEYLKASLRCARLNLKDAETTASRLIGAMFKTYFADIAPGGWHDEIDQNGAVLSRSISPSTIYHIISAAGAIAEHAQRDAVLDAEAVHSAPSSVSGAA